MAQALLDVFVMAEDRDLIEESEVPEIAGVGQEQIEDMLPVRHMAIRRLL